MSMKKRILALLLALTLLVPSGCTVRDTVQVLESSVTTLQELADEPYLLLEEGCYSEPLEAFRKAGVTPNVRLTMHDDYSILSMVEQGLGYSLLAELVLQKTAYDVAVRPVDEPILRTMALVMKDKRGLSAAAKTFIRFILAENIV